MVKWTTISVILRLRLDRENKFCSDIHRQYDLEIIIFYVKRVHGFIPLDIIVFHFMKNRSFIECVTYKSINKISIKV